MSGEWNLLAAAGGAETISRGIHLLCAMLAVGELVFQRLALRPALEANPNAELAESIRRRWAPMTHIAITLLLVTGMYQLMKAGIPKGKEDSAYHMWFGIKFVAALGIFFIVTALAGRSAAFEKLRQKGGLWGSIAIVLALVVIAISLHLRAIPVPA